MAAKTNILDWDINTNYDYNTAKKPNGDQKGRRPNHTASITSTKTNGKYHHHINIIGKSWAWDKDRPANDDKIGGYSKIDRGFDEDKGSHFVEVIFYMEIEDMENVESWCEAEGFDNVKSIFGGK